MTEYTPQYIENVHESCMRSYNVNIIRESHFVEEEDEDADVSYLFRRRSIGIRKTI